MATQTTDQQNALKDAMARAKQIAAKLQQQSTGTETAEGGEENRKRSFHESGAEPVSKRAAVEGAVDHTDPKIIAQQVANSLVQRAGIGSMLVEEVSIPNKLVGLVIGRGGEMINRLQSDSGAKIQVAPDPPQNLLHLVEDRQITITGSQDAVNKAKQLIEQIRTEGKVPERLMMAAAMPGEYSIDLPIPAGKVGLVIGKGGETIKALQERADCKMVLFQDGEYAHATEKPLRISGEQPKVMYGKQLVQDLIISKEIESVAPDRMNSEGGTFEEVPVPKEAVGFVIGAKGANINNIQQLTGCRIQFKNDMEGEFKTATLHGTPQAIVLGKEKLMEILQAHQDRVTGRGSGHINWRLPQPNMGHRPAWGMGQPNQLSMPRNAWGSPQAVGGPRPFNPRVPGQPYQPRMGHGGNPVLQPGHKHMEIEVPAGKCGLIIGKGGETLKFIHRETGVNIEINRQTPDSSPFRTFHLRGTDDQIEKSQTIIRDKVGDQSLTAKLSEDNESEQQQALDNQSRWGPPNNSQWGSQQPNQQWDGQNWSQSQAHDQWNQQGYPQQQARWNQQQQTAAGGWNPQQQQWQQAGAQWGAQAWSQPQAVSTAGQADGTQATTAQATQGGQPDYSAAWAAYYQQQNQYYQQYGMQAPGTPATSTQAPGTPTSTATQAAAMADYQAKMAEYYKSFGQQQQQPQTQTQ